MTWGWWAAIIVYVVGAAGGMVYAGSRYQRDEDRLGREYAAVDAFGTYMVSVIWPIVSIIVVLYYVITAPFWLGKRIESRKTERRRALAKQHREQADNLHRMAEDYEQGSTERQILLDSAQHLAAEADTLK